MCTHRAILKTRNHILEDGTAVPVVKEEIPIGTEYIVDCSKSPRGLGLYYNSIVGRFYTVSVAYVTRIANLPTDPPDVNLSGILPVTVFEFLEDIVEA